MLQPGDKVRIKAGIYLNLEGEIGEIENDIAWVLFNCYYTKEHFEEKYYEYKLNVLEKLNK